MLYLLLFKKRTVLYIISLININNYFSKNNKNYI